MSRDDVQRHQRGLLEVGLPRTEHDKLPDVILHDRGPDRLFLIEAVTSHGPVDRNGWSGWQ